MKQPISAQHLAAALVQLSMLKFFPSDDKTQRAILLYFQNLCSDSDSLGWLVAQLVNHVGEWPGPAQVRGLLCTRYRPKDNIEGYCSLPGFTPDDCAARSAIGPPPLQRFEAAQLLESIRPGTSGKLKVVGR